MPSRFLLALVAAIAGAIALLAATTAFAAAPGPPIPETITLPTKTPGGDPATGGETITGTVCLDQVPSEPTLVNLLSDNDFVVEIQPSVTIEPPDQCAEFTAIVYDRGFTRTVSIVVSAFANGDSAQTVLYVIPEPGTDLIEITKATVNRSFTRVVIEATSDEPGAILTAYTAGMELGQLTQKGDRYVGRFDLNGTPINNVEVISSLGGCAQRAVPFGNSSTHC